MHLGQTKEFDASKAVAVNSTINIAGLTRGTTVMTLDGERPVEDLSVGDRIITRDAGMAVLREIRRKSATIAPIKIKAGSLGHTRPHNDMIVAPDTLIHIRDWRAKALFGADVATVKAKRLTDGEFVAEQDITSVSVFEIVFDKQHVIYADGLEVASSTT